jgi:hypothetical protein
MSKEHQTYLQDEKPPTGIMAGAVLTCFKEEKLTTRLCHLHSLKLQPLARGLLNLLLDSGIRQELLGVPGPVGEAVCPEWLYKIWLILPGRLALEFVIFETSC